MELRLKKEYEGTIIERRFVGRGTVIVEADKLTKKQMEHHYRNGFDDIFEYVVEEQKEKEKEDLPAEPADILEQAKKEVKNYSKNKK